MAALLLSVAVCSSAGCTAGDWSSASGYPGDGDDGGPGPNGSGSSSGGGNGDDASSVFGNDAAVGFSAIRPDFGSTVVAAVPPPPISGGTLLVTADGSRAIAADPDRDVVFGVLLSTSTVAYTVSLKAGDEPGRLAEDGAGRVHVALRGGGALVTIDERTGAILARRTVCPAPRGVAWDSTTDDVWVACATGELVALPAAGGAAVQMLTVERDLRDVIVQSGALSITEFRNAQMLRMRNGATVARRDQLPSPLGGFIPHVAWRAVAGPSDTVVAVHQASTTASVPTQMPSAYGGCGSQGIPQAPPPPQPVDAGDAAIDASPDVPDAGAPGSAFNDAGCAVPVGQDGGPSLDPDAGGCGPGVVQGVLSILSGSGQVLLNETIPAALPVDVAVARDGSKIAVAAPGNAFVPSLPTVFLFDPCGGTQTTEQTTADGTSVQPTAVAFDASGDLVVQTREPAALYVYGAQPRVIPLASSTRKDTGHDIFNTQAGAMIACASCHPEGRDDGHVWLLDGFSRRTPSLRGTIAGTAPYHWPGDKPNLVALADDVYTTRMDGAALAPDQLSALQGWVEKIPAPPAPSWIDPSAAQRGKALFTSGSVGCSVCHTGAKFTNNATMDVGTGGSFQVPPLVGVGWRTPLLHDGCATTIADRFGKCATSQHGNIGSLTSQNISDLTAYLETL